MHADELLILLCNGEAGPQEKVSRPENRIKQAIELVRCSLETDLTLSALAEIVGLDPVYLCRAFRLAVGLPPHAYRNRLRVARAATLIRQGHQAMDAAVAVGFFDQSHLARHMKAQLGQTPGQLKKSISSKTMLPPQDTVNE